MLLHHVLVPTVLLGAAMGSQTYHIGMKGKQANLDRYDGKCGGNSNDLKLFFNTESVRFEKNVLYINHTVTVTDDIPAEDLMMTVKITRCKSKENPDTCEVFYRQTFQNYCDFLTSKSPLWRPYYDAIEPKLECPMRKGVYRGTNSAIQASAFLLKPATGYFWKVNVEILQGKEKKLISCAVAEAQVGVTNGGQE